MAGWNWDRLEIHNLRGSLMQRRIMMRNLHHMKMILRIIMQNFCCLKTEVDSSVDIFFTVEVEVEADIWYITSLDTERWMLFCGHPIEESDASETVDRQIFIMGFLALISPFFFGHFLPPFKRFFWYPSLWSIFINCKKCANRKVFKCNTLNFTFIQNHHALVLLNLLPPVWESKRFISVDSSIPILQLILEHPLEGLFTQSEHNLFNITWTFFLFALGLTHKTFLVIRSSAVLQLTYQNN